MSALHLELNLIHDKIWIHGVYLIGGKVEGVLIIVLCHMVHVI
jgi:hypothetical protein